MKVKELIKELEKYDGETDVSAGYFTSQNWMVHAYLIIRESHPIGDRESEYDLSLWIGCKSTGFNV